MNNLSEQLTDFAARVHSKMGSEDHSKFWELVRALETKTKTAEAIKGWEAVEV